MRTGLNLATLLLVSLLISCHSAAEKRFGSAFNADRQKVGLPLLPDNWKLVKSSDDHILWSTPGSWGSVVYAKKEIQYEGHRIKWEENLFQGPDSFTTVYGRFRETIWICCRFESDSPIYWDCRYEGPKNE